jgi:hypothetical protein
MTNRQSSPQRFVDTQGNVWTIHVDVGAVKRVRRLTDVDLLAVVEGDLLDRLSRDPVLLCDVLFAICQPQAERLEISDEQFAAGLAGDVIAEGTAALLAALVNFFPEPQRRLLAQAAEKYETMKAKAIDLVAARLADPRIEQEAMAKIQQELRTSNSGG